MEKIAFNFTLLQYHRIKPWLLFVFSAHPCTVISYCNVMFNGIKHIIPHIASILELISSENQCTFSYERLQTWSNATLWLHAHDIHYQHISLKSFYYRWSKMHEILKYVYQMKIREKNVNSLFMVFDTTIFGICFPWEQNPFKWKMS